MGPFQLPPAAPLLLIELMYLTNERSGDDGWQCRPTAAGVKLMLKSPKVGPTLPVKIMHTINDVLYSVATQQAYVPIESFI